jgi:twitching motility protein PilT
MAPKPDVIAPLLDEVHASGASDLHLVPGLPPLQRLNGQLMEIGGQGPLSGQDVDRIAKALLADDLPRLDSEGDLDFSFSWRDHSRFRGNAYLQSDQVAIALRAIPLRIPTLAELGVPDVVATFMAAPSGLVIVTGPTGAGKSTTLASLIDRVSAERACHILTLEDPIEYVFEHRRAVITQREIGPDAPSFASGLRAALREDPDVVFVGEMRDLDSIQATLTIAETGHLVLASLHTNDTSQAIDRIVDVFPAERRPQIQLQLASTLQGIVFQRLLPSIEGRQMAAAFEVLVANHAVRNLVREGRSRQLRNVIATSAAEGMETFEDSLSALVAAGKVTYEVAVGASLHPKEVKAPPPPPPPPPAAAAASRRGRRRDG